MLNISTGSGFAFAGLCLTALPIILRLLPKKAVIQDVSPAILDFLGENTKAVLNLEKTFQRSIDQNDRTHKATNFIKDVVKNNFERIEVAIKDIGEMQKTASDTNTTVAGIAKVQEVLAPKILNG